MDSKLAAQRISENLPAIYGYAFARLYNKDDAEELTSEIVCEILSSAERLKEDGAFWGKVGPSDCLFATFRTFDEF